MPVTVARCSTSITVCIGVGWNAASRCWRTLLLRDRCTNGWPARSRRRISVCRPADGPCGTPGGMRPRRVARSRRSASLSPAVGEREVGLARAHARPGTAPTGCPAARARCRDSARGTPPARRAASPPPAKAAPRSRRGRAGAAAWSRKSATMPSKSAEHAARRVLEQPPFRRERHVARVALEQARARGSPRRPGSAR